MKQIFDWLREQINKNIYSIPLQNNHGVKFKSIDIADAENIINEAEAKWEAECCEWTRCEISKHIIVSPHNPVFSQFDVNLKLTPYCPACGKKIKITEVE